MSTPVPRYGWPALILGAWGKHQCASDGLGTKHTPEGETRSNSSATAKLDHVKRYRGSPTMSNRSLPILHFLLLGCMDVSIQIMRAGDTDSRIVSLDGSNDWARS